jgi:2-C-methyl-D-erythritol 4-phosphate cytidylyltransferase
MADVAVVIPAGGSGTRIGARTPKQFLALGPRTILEATAAHFARHPAVRVVVVAAPQEHLVRTRRLLGPIVRRPALTVVAGGATRQESVRLGLEAVPSAADIVVVHDAVRPFITRALIDAVVEVAGKTGAAVCALPIAETVKRVRGGLVEATLDRAGLWAIQTPQAFRTALLREAHDKALRDGAQGTDDAMLVERLGQPVGVVPGLAGNVKITTPEDLRKAREWSRR